MTRPNLAPLCLAENPTVPETLRSVADAITSTSTGGSSPETLGHVATWLQSEAQRLERPGPKYPEVCVPLPTADESLFTTMARASHAMKDAGLPLQEQKRFTIEAMNGNHPTFLRTLQAWFTTT